MLTAVGADKAIAVAVADFARNAAADHGRELITCADLDNLHEARRAGLVELESRLTWRLAAAMLVEALAILTGVLAMLRLLEY